MRSLKVCRKPHLVLLVPLQIHILSCSLVGPTRALKLCHFAFRKIPGYPKIDANNDYFLARFDGALIDGQSWGRGRDLLHKQQDMGMTFHNNRHANLAELHHREVCLHLTHTHKGGGGAGPQHICY